MPAGGVLLGRDRNREQRMPGADRSDKIVAEESLGADLGRGPTKHADLEIDQPLSQRACVLLWLGPAGV